MGACQLTRDDATDDADLMGSAEVAALLGVSRQRVLQLASRPDFPRPVAVLRMGQVWRGSDIRRWGKRYRGTT
jgi:predicted DNA-binding transcriptional regulator AlpA